MATPERSPYHVAVFVDDFSDSSLDVLSSWRMRSKSPTFTVHSHKGGTEELCVEALFVRTDPELEFSVAVEHIDDFTFIRPNPGNGWHHVGYWSDDFVAEVARLESEGWSRDVWWEDEDGGVAFFAYMLSAQGLRVELTDLGTVQRILREQGDNIAREMIGDETAPFRAVDHVAAVVDDPEAEARALERALGVRWGDPVESEVVVFDGGGERAFVTRSITSLSAPPLRFVQREWAGSRVPGDRDGWDHVAFRSSQLDEDVAALQQAGYERLARWPGSQDGEASVLLSAPEGTRVKLVS